MAKQFPTWVDGEVITGTNLRHALPRYAYKLTNHDKRSSTAMTPDPDLQIDLEPYATYTVEINLFFGGSADAIIEGIWDVPLSTTGLRGVRGPSSSATAADNIMMRTGSHNLDTHVAYGYRSSDELNLQFAQETGVVTTDFFGGPIAYAWGQSASSTTRVRMGRSSWMRVIRIA